MIRSAGRVFCSGADLSEAADGWHGGRCPGVDRAAASDRDVDAPVVVELGGPVRAGGLGIVGAADIVIAAESVSFALTEVRLALAPAVISVTLLERFTSRAAADLFLTGRTFDATEAAAAGLITRVVPDAELDGQRRGRARRPRSGLPAGSARDEGAAQPRPRAAHRCAGARSARHSRPPCSAATRRAKPCSRSSTAARGEATSAHANRARGGPGVPGSRVLDAQPAVGPFAAGSRSSGAVNNVMLARPSVSGSRVLN